jgi:hypothetical protein
MANKKVVKIEADVTITTNLKLSDIQKRQLEERLKSAMVLSIPERIEDGLIDTSTKVRPSFTKVKGSSKRR